MITNQNHKRIYALALLLILGAPPLSANTRQAAYFSPGESVKERLLHEIQNAQSSIDLAIFNFTSRSLETALKKAHKRGVQIRIIADAEKSRHEDSVIKLLVKDGLAIKLIKGRGRSGIMHHKFAIFDRKLLLTGSYNWTNSAENYNYENSLFLRDKALIDSFDKEFNSLWASA